MYRKLYGAQVNWDGTAAAVEVVGPGGAFDSSGEIITRIIRDVAGTEEFKEYGFYVVNDVGELIDGLEEVYSQTPAMMSGTVFTVVFFMSLVAFRDLLLSVRLLFTIFITAVWVYASMVCFYQDIHHLSGIYWIIPIACGPLVCGLALDYDTLLISRIYEYRHEGYNNVDSIMKGLEKTGGIITTAGFIMMVAFSALLFSSETVLNQFGFALVSASFIDTFFVRTIIVPAILFIMPDSLCCGYKVPNPCSKQHGSKQTQTDSLL
jgi:RND superfamily putative drug exporter